MKTVYSIKGTNKETGEVSTYIGQTTNLARRLSEHSKSGLIDNLVNDGKKLGLFGRKAKDILEQASLPTIKVLSYQSNNPNEDEKRDIQRQNGRCLNKQYASNL